MTFPLNSEKNPEEYELKLSFFVFIFTFIFATPGWSSSNFALGLACLQKNDCSEQSQKVKKQFQWNCELEVKAQNCEKLAQDHPEWAPLMRQCDFQAQCADLEKWAQQKTLACLRGYKNALVDLGISLKDMSVSLAGLVDDSWETFKKNNKEKNAFIKECNKSLDCKRDLVKDDHRYNRLSSEELAKLPASFLYVQAQDMKAYKSSLDRVRPQAYVPISERKVDDTRLTSEQSKKLESLMNIAADKVKEQYSRYSCYNSLAQEELKCYALGTVIDPTMVAGYFVKGARLTAAVSKLSKSEKLPVTSAKISRADLSSRYLSYSPTTVEQNTLWIARAEKGVDSKVTFLDVENSQMKYLNDSLKDKNLVTGLTNYHKEMLFERIDQLEAANPGLKIDRYSDFKSSRFAFSGKVPKDIEAQLQRVLKETNDEFISQLKSSDVLKIADQPEDWFRAGIGNSADEANLAARYSRQSEKNELQSFQRDGFKTAMQRKLDQIEVQRQSLRKEVEGTDLLDGNTFHTDVYDIVRKGKGDTAQVEASLKSRFALQSLPTGTVKKLTAYVEAADEFSPGIFIAKREVAHLNNASQGGLSADIIGLGAANLKGTAEALAGSSNLSKALQSTRSAEKKVTIHFTEQKKYFEKVLAESVAEGKLKSLCSGDDCVAVAVKPLNVDEKNRILKGLATSQYSGSYRLAFIPDGVKIPETRNALANHGESIEKILRQSLGASMEPRKLKGLTFGVDMRTQNLNQGDLKLLMGEASGVRLSEQERQRIQQAFTEAVKKFNREMVSNGAPADYQALP